MHFCVCVTSLDISCFENAALLKFTEYQKYTVLENGRETSKGKF